jgi:hypothetical protein
MGVTDLNWKNHSCHAAGSDIFGVKHVYGPARFFPGRLTDGLSERVGEQGRDLLLSRWELLAALSKITSLQPSDVVTD